GKKAAATRARGREVATLERKSPPFAEKREGWGTLKYVVKHRCQDNPRNERQDSKTRPALEVAAHSDVKAAASRRTPKPPCLGDCADMGRSGAAPLLGKSKPGKTVWQARTGTQQVNVIRFKVGLWRKNLLEQD